MAKLAYFHFILILFLYNFQTFEAINKNENSTFGLKILHWNSPELPSHKPNQTREEILEELVRISNARVKALEHLRLENTSYFINNQGPIRPPLERTNSLGLFVVEVGIGTFQSNPPFQKTYLLLDLTNDRTWTQCEGCSPFFPQRDPLFQWHYSSTYIPTPCSQCPPNRCRTPGQCVVNFSFGSGVAASDTFTYQSTYGGYIQVPFTEFFCVTSSHGFLGSGVESGVLALGPRGYPSLMTNVHDARINNGRFSYCLPPIDEPIQSPMYLHFGDDIPHIMERRKTVPIIPPHQAGLHAYYLPLIDFSVGGIRLKLNPEDLSIKADGSGGCIIDPATPFSILPPVFYDKVERRVARQYEAANTPNVRRVRPSPLPAFPLCFAQLNEAIIHDSPNITFQFAGVRSLGAGLTVKQSMGHYTHNGVRLHCLQIGRATNFSSPTF